MSIWIIQGINAREYGNGMAVEYEDERLGMLAQERVRAGCLVWWGERGTAVQC